jgi:hypothetical protein
MTFPKTFSITISLEDKAQSILDELDEEYDDPSAITEIHRDIPFKYNSVNLLIGRRGSGKTTFFMKELIKLSLLKGAGYKEAYIITDKLHDDTVSKFMPAVRIPLHVKKVDEAEELIKTITEEKVTTHSRTHTIVFFDDCISLFSKPTSLSKLLYENRQALITYFLALQDVHGLSPSMKSNINTLVLFGGYSEAKINSLLYQLPMPEDRETFYHEYKQLKPNQCAIIQLS